MLRRPGIAFAVFALSAVAGFAQSPGASPPPLRGFVAPYEILRTLRAAGFQPLAPPLREGTTYVVRAVDFRGVPMRVAVDARSGAIRDANRIVSGPGLYGPYAPGPYAPVYYGRFVPPPYPPDDEIESGYGRPPFGMSDLQPADRHSSGFGLVPVPRPRPGNVAAHDGKPILRPDVAASAPATPQPDPLIGKGAALPPIND